MGTRTPQDRLDNSRRLGDPLVCREQAPKARAVSPPGGRLGPTSGDPRQHWRDRPRREPDERADGPEPGHLMARSARRRRDAGRALGRRAIGTGAPGECRGRPRVNARVGCRRRARPALKDACAAAKKEVSTGTNRRSVDLAVLHACARARRRATPQPLETARGRRDGAGREPAKPQVTGPLRRRPPTEGGGGLCPNHGSSRTKRSHGLAR